MYLSEMLRGHTYVLCVRVCVVWFLAPHMCVVSDRVPHMTAALFEGIRWSGSASPASHVHEGMLRGRYYGILCVCVCGCECWNASGVGDTF